MSELVKTFSFDLQRFTASESGCTFGDIKTGDPSSVTPEANKAYWTSGTALLAGTIPTTTKINATLTKTEIQDASGNGTGKYYYVIPATIDSIELTGNTTFTTAAAATVYVNGKTLTTTLSGTTNKYAFNSKATGDDNTATLATTGVTAITLGTKGAAVTVDKTTATNHASAGLSINGGAIKATATGFTYTYNSDDDQSVALDTVSTKTTAVTIDGLTNVTSLIPAKGSNVGLKIGSTNTWDVVSAGKAYFTLDSGAEAGFVFAATKDSVSTATPANLAKLKLYHGSTDNEIEVDLSGISTGAATNTITRNSNDYTIKAFGDNDKITLGEVTATFTVKGTKATESATFTSAGVLTGLTVDGSAADAAVKVEGASGTDISVNGSAINATGDSFTLTYKDAKSKNILLEVTDGANVTKTGVANEVYLASGDATVLGTTITEATMTADTSYLVTDGKKVLGAVLGASDTLTIDGTTAANFAIYTDQTATAKAPSVLFTPKITNAADTVTFAANSSNYTIKGFQEGSTITDGKNTLTFTTGGENAVVTINGTTKLISGVTGLAAGDVVDVDGTAAISFGTESITGTDAFGVDSGKYQVAIDEDDDAKMSLILKKDGETLVTDSNKGLAGAGNATKVVPAEGSTTLKVKNSTTVTHTFATSGNAYFTAASGALEGFVFIDKGDALTLTTDTAAAITKFYYTTDQTEIDPSAISVQKNSANTPYTLKLNDATAGEELFEITGFADKSIVNSEYTFSKGTGALVFKASDPTVATEVTTGGGTVTFAAGTALAATDDASLKIDGTAVNITVAGTDIVYDAATKSFKELDDGSVIVDAGPATKIYIKKPTAADTSLTYTFGEEDAAKEFTVTGQKDSTAFFTVEGTKVTGFQFSKKNDAITGDLADFKLYDTQGNSFVSPTVENPDSESSEATVTMLTVDKVFAIVPVEKDIVTFSDGTTLTFDTLNIGEKDPQVAFDNKGALVGVYNITEADTSIVVKAADTAGAIKIGKSETDAKEINITGGDYTYELVDNDGTVTPIIKDLKDGANVIKTQDITEARTAGGTSAAGTFTIMGTAIKVTGEDNEDGVLFTYDSKLNGISSVDGTASVTGALNGLKLNGNSEALNITGGASTFTFSGLSVAGLTDGANVVKAGGASDFLTAVSGQFTILGGSMSIAGDADGVVFKTDGASLTGIDSLAGSAIGNFTGGLSVNSIGVKVTNDDAIKVVGNNEGVTEIHELGGKGVAVVSASGASLVGANADGDFTFTFAGGASFALEGNKTEETTFTFENNAVTAIDGLDDGEIVAGSFSSAIKVEGKAIEITGDNSVSIQGGASSAILGLTGGASVVQSGGVKFAVTDSEGQFTFKNGAFSIAGDKEVTFVLDADGNVTGINGVDDNATVSGALNNVAINEGEPFDIRDNENYSYSPNSGVSGVVDTDTVKSANGAKNVWVSGTDFTVTFENGSFSVAGETDGVNFLVKDTNIAIGVESLDAGATMSGDFTQLTTVNGVSFAVKDGDNSISIVGGDAGITQILGLTAEGVIENAGGASLAKTDKAGKFTFGGASGVSFETADDNEVTFGLNAKTGAVETISGLSGAVKGDFKAITSINDKKFDVKDSDGVLTVYGNETADDLAKIAGVTGDATIGEVGSVSQVVTDKAGKFTFSGGVSFTTGDGADEVTFGLSSSKVVSISDLNGSAIGGFSGIQVNGADIDITDGDNQLKVFGDGKVLTAIQDVDADATINKAGGVAELVGNIAASSGTFTFANSGEFKVEGDSSVAFQLNTAADAEVVGISDLNGAVTGSFSGISSVNGKTFSVVDADGVLTVYGDGSDITKIAGVTGSASIGQVGGVSQILTDKAGQFAFTNGSWSVAGDDEVTFGMSASKVVSISELVGTVEGAFEDVTVNGQNFQISGDSSIALVGGASGVTAIEKLSGGADIARAEGYLTATTDSEGTFTFANGRTIQVLGDSSVVFGLNNGLVMSIDELDETATIIGAINNIAINGSSSMFDVRNNANLWYSNGTLSAVVDGNTVVSADGATTVQVSTDGTYTFGNGAFQIAGDQDGVAQFTVSDSSIATAINGVDAGATVTGALNGMAINGGSALVVENDDSFGAVAGDGVLAKLINLSDGANVVEAGGASQFVTDAEGSYTILGTAMQIESDDEVTFTAGASGITAIDGLEGTATGDFQNVIAVNTNDVQVLNDSVVAVSSEGAEVTAIDQVSDGATVAAVGGAVEVGTDTEGNFTFAVAGDSQAFTVEEDAEVTFQLEEGAVVGVNELENGKLTFDTATTALTLNDDESFTIQTSTNASFSVADNSVNYVTGVDGAIEGLVNATVVATGAMEVNGTNIDVQDDADFKVIVQDGEVVGLADISGGAKVNVAGVSIAVDSNGELEIGGKQYSFNDSIDGAFNLTTGDESALTGVDAFAGEMVIASPADQALTVNGDALGFLSTADSVTVATDGVEVTAVNGLVNNDAVTVGAGASIAMPGSTASVRGEGSFLKVNEVTYELLNDDNGVTVTGGRQVTDLNESASLFVSEKGKYTVNGNGSDIEVEDTNMPIIGLDGATDAYIYDPAHLIVRKSTPVSEIESMLGLPTEYETKFGGDDVNHENDDPNDDPLNSAGLSSMFANADLNQPLEIFATNDEKTAQDIPLAGTDFSKKVHLFRGDQNVTFNNAGGNLAVVESESSGTKNIALGDMGDAVISKADAGDGSQVNVVGGAGDDSVVVQGSAPVNFDMSEGGADKLVTFASSNARIALAGYDALANPNAGVHIAERWASLADAITAGLLNFANGVMSIGTDPNANAQIDLGTNIVNLFNYLGQKQAVGFTNDAGGLVDASTAQDPVILIGNDKGQKTGDSTLLGGSGDDTAIAGGGDNIDLGAGNNEVRLQQDINRAGADVTLAQGRTTITGFIGSFNAQHGDVIKTDLSNANVSFDGTNVVIEGDGFYGVIADAITNGELVYDTATDVTESADLVESADSSSASVLATAQGDYTNVLFDDEGAISKTAIAKEGGVIDVKLDFDARPNNFIGNDSGITFYDHTGEVLVNLAQGAGSIDTEAVTYSGINKVAAGAGQTTMIGGESNETLIAGQGNDSIWGAGGKNLLMGYNDVANDKTGQTSFFVVAEADGAANTLRGFNFVDDDSWNTNTNQITADKLDIQVQYDYIDAERDVDISGDDVVLFVNNRNKESSESVVIEGARGKNFVVSGNDIVNDVVAQVNTDNLVADKFANYFVATGKNATLTVGNDIDTANIYLDNKTPDGSDYLGDVPQFYGDIHVIDASGSNAKVELGGNLYDNTIIGGTGDASLWGGDGGNDLLVGGTGANTFFYNAGDGNDTITGAHDGDVVDLTNVQLSDIVDANSAITSSGVELKFKDGGSLTVNSTADVAYKVGEDTYVVNDDRDGWTKK